MTKRTDRALDSDELNPNGTARRRLIKALGLGAVASQLTLDWHSPEVRLGALPAHAQSTVDAACTVTLDVSIYPSATTPITVEFLPDLISTIVIGSSTTDSTTFTLPASEHFDVSLAWNLGSATAGIGVEFAATCCTANYSNSYLAPTGTQTVSYLFGIITADTGECGFEAVCTST